MLAFIFLLLKQVMKAPNTTPLAFKTITDLLVALDLPKPTNALVALVNYDKVSISKLHVSKSFLLDFYKVSFKNNFKGKVKYGQGNYNFEDGGLAFLAPNQRVTFSADERNFEGYALYFHADLFRKYNPGKMLEQYGFFSYTTSEALLLTAEEKKVVRGLFESIEWELTNSNDAFSQDVLASQIELLLNHSNRFYNRQFFTHKNTYTALIGEMDTYLNHRINNIQSSLTGLPTVAQVADQLQVSTRYLNDLLKALTGQSTQQRIQSSMIEKAKNMLANTTLGIAEIAYQLGFEHPQSFNKLFKRSTAQSPGAYRRSFK